MFTGIHWTQSCLFSHVLFCCVFPLLKVSHDGMSFEITQLILVQVNNLCYLIKILSLFPACAIYSPFVALLIFVVLSNFCRIIKLLPSWGFELFFLGIYISLVISHDIPSCENFSTCSFSHFLLE